MSTGYYVIVRDQTWGREFYRWSDALMDVLWVRFSIYAATRWTAREDAEKVAALHKGARVLHRTD